ncbi:22173_t:CDS:2, partial [Gigaspora margarita]
MAPTKLKIKGNKAFSLLSTIDTDEDLSKTWRLMTKVKDALEYGMRLENLSWRLWFMHHLMVHDQKTRNQFKRLSNATTKKLEIEKATELKDLSAPSYHDEKNITNVTSITDSTTLEIDENILVNGGHDVSHDDTEDVLTSMNDSRSLEDIWNDVHSFSLRQYTSDQDPFQVVSLPSIFDRINAQALLHPNHQPIMQLDLDQMIGVYNISPEHSEPNSPTIEWYENNILPPDTITQQTSNLQFSMPNSSLSPGIHGAVYVPRTTGGSPVNSSINSNLIASMNTSSNGLSNNNNLLNEQQCFNCGVTSTPLWRRSANDELLCNALRKDARDDEAAQPVCSNCNTMTTPLWRRDEEGQTLCNACGLYFKLHHERRPLSMKTDVIKKRQRYENGQTPNRRKKQRSPEPEQD